MVLDHVERKVPKYENHKLIPLICDLMVLVTKNTSIPHMKSNDSNMVLFVCPLHHNGSKQTEMFWCVYRVHVKSVMST